MMKHSLILIVLLAIALNAKTQPFENEYADRFYKPMSGISVLLTNFGQNAPTDRLMPLNRNFSYLQFFSGGYAINQNISLEFSLQHGIIDDHYTRVANFNNYLEETYDSEYYITSWVDQYRESEGKYLQRYTVALKYRFGDERYYLIPKIAFGGISIPASRADVYLKGRDSNKFVSKRYRPYDDEAFFTFGPGLSLEYRLYRHILMALDLQYFYFRPNMRYDITTSDQVLQEYTTETIHYTKGIHSIDFGFGLVFELSYKEYAREGY